MIVAPLCRESCDRLDREDRRAPPLAGAGRVGGARGALPPQALGVQQVLAVRGGSDEETESYRAAQVLKQAFPGPFAEYVAIVVHGPISRANQRFGVVLDTLAAAMRRRSYVREVVAASSLGESTFVSRDRRTTF